MGDYRITVEGVGTHHCDAPHAAESIARDLVEALRAAGHSVKSAKVEALSYEHPVVVGDPATGRRFGGGLAPSPYLPAVDVLAIPRAAAIQVVEPVLPEPPEITMTVEFPTVPVGAAEK